MNRIFLPFTSMCFYLLVKMHALLRHTCFGKWFTSQLIGAVRFSAQLRLRIFVLGGLFMKKQIRKVIAILLTITIILSLFSISAVSSMAYSIPSESEFVNKLNILRETYPNGSRWSGTYYEGNTPKAWSCHGYALQLLREVFGVNFYNDGLLGKEDYNNATINAGDLVRINNDSHSIFITKVTNDLVYFTDANWDYNNGIRWDAAYTWAEIRSKFTYRINIGGSKLTGNGVADVTNVWVNPTKKRLHIGESNSFSLGAENANRIDIKIEKDGSEWVYQQGVTSGVSYTFNEAGQYSVYIAGVNSSSNIGSPRAYFTVFDDINLGSIFYATITNVKSGLLLTASNTSTVTDNVIIKQNNINDDQKWLFERNSDGSYKITNANRNKCLDVAGGHAEDGTNIQVYPSNGSDAQKWYIVPSKDGYAFIPKSSTNSAMDVGGGSLSDGANINEWTWNGTAAQAFFIDYKSLSPSSSIERNGHRYDYYCSNTTWSQAYRYCEQQGGHLITITSESENNLVLELTNGYVGAVWIGATDYYNNSIWHWINSESFSYSKWNTNEPNDYKGQEFFATIDISGNNIGKWNDMPMNSKLVGGFICEYDDVINPNEYSPVNSIIDGEFRYDLFDNTVDWCTAKRICEKKGGKLLSISNTTENAEISSFIKSGSKSFYWINYSDYELEGNWKSYNYGANNYTNWQLGEPNNAAGLENYAVINVSDGFWNDISSFDFAHKSLGFICKTPLHKIGDTNLDGHITISDVTSIQRHIAELEVFTDEQIALADTNGDGEINIADATHLQMYIAEYDGIVLEKS